MFLLGGSTISDTCPKKTICFALSLKELVIIYIIKVVVQPGLGNNGRNFGRNLNHHTSYLLIYKCEVAKLGSKAGNFLAGKRGGRGRRERQRER